MTRTPRRRLRPDDRRLEIMEAAERVLRDKGSTARVDDVVREAGAAKGTFYVYFPTWEALLAAVRERVFANFDTRFPLPREAPADWLAMAEERAMGFVDFVLELGGLHEAIFHGPFTPAGAPDPGADASARVAALLEAGMAAGGFGDLDSEPTSRLIFAVLHQAADAIAQGKDRARELSAMTRVLRQILRAAAP